MPGIENARSETQQRVPRPKLTPAEIKVNKKVLTIRKDNYNDTYTQRRYQSRMRHLTGRRKADVRLPIQHAYVDEGNIERERLTNALEARLVNAETQRKKQMY